MRRHHGHSSVPACDGSQDVLWLAVEWREKDGWRKVVPLRSKEKGPLARRKMPVILSQDHHSVYAEQQRL
jgi:hypothetical protein